MGSSGLTFYSHWRRQASGSGAFSETAASTPNERLLQAIWHHQRVRRSDLRTADGRPLRVLHPGFWNHEAGPDFRNALLQFGDDPPRAGDVEVDVRSSDWRGHGHDRNRAFTNIVLHIVWQPSGRAPDLPSLELRNYLDSPIEELALWLDETSAIRAWPEFLSGTCCKPLGDLPDGRLDELLRQAALFRLQRKASDLGARARQAGWEQALWEGLFRGLGYKHNIWPMQRIGELLPDFLRQQPGTALEWQALLLGAGGLLPSDLKEGRSAETAPYMRRVWDIWWREQGAFGEVNLPRAAWSLAGLRPANHPQRRLALASHWLASGTLACRLEDWFMKIEPGESLSLSLLKILEPGVDDYWSHHWTLRCSRLEKPQPLIGQARATDLAVNVILPWFWMRAEAGGNPPLREKVETCYFAWPAAQDNSVLRMARNRLLARTQLGRMRRAAAQQGLLQVVRDFCAHSNAICADCQFPDLVREWKQRGSEECRGEIG